MPDNQLQIRAKDDDIKGSYSNIMEVKHTKEEFCLDFLNIFPPVGALTARVIVSPGHLKRMIKALNDNLGVYEKNFGPIEPAPEPAGGIGFKIH
jgi:hypothetical protein